jgi:hypothetical protein
MYAVYSFQQHMLEPFSSADLTEQTPKKHYKVSRAIPKNYSDVSIPVLKA